MSSKPKLLDEPITKADLEEFIKTQDDFALELYAYSLARELGFTTTHAGSYTDRVTGKTRQFDVRASRACGRNFHVHFAIECKCLRPSFPLLISQIPRLPAESYLEVLHGRGEMHRYPPVAVSPKIDRLDGVKSLYPPNQYVGKASIQVGKDSKGFSANDSEIFDKWGQAIASANDLIVNATWLNRQESIILPVLVVTDGTLWVVNYAEEGSRQEGPTQVDEVKFFIGNQQNFEKNPIFSYTISHLHVVTKSGLSNLLQRFMTGGQDFLHLYPPLPELDYDEIEPL
jgi:hypothetical protein